MKVLFVNWGAYTELDLIEMFQKQSVQVKLVSYCFADKNEDLFFEKRFTEYLRETQWDAVFSVNYFPVIAQCCRKQNIKYLSWSYDNPLNVNRIDETLGYETNRVFLFDRIQAEGYVSKGFTNVYHLPLAVNEDRMRKLTVTRFERERLGADVTFVGKLYSSPFPELLKRLGDFERGYLEAAADAQLMLYGAYILKELLTPDWMNRINQSLQDSSKAGREAVSREQLEYAIASHVTRTERLLILGLLSSHYQVKLFSREQNEVLKRVDYMGSAGYLTDMPKAFSCAGVNLNITLKSSQSGIPLRVMDIFGAGGLLLSNYQQELAEYFIPEEDFILYDSVEDTLEKVAFYRKRPELGDQIKRNGMKKVYENFSYRGQMRKLFQTADVM